jgi:hypothetical protein
VIVTLISAWQADATPGDDDTTFVPITPCRRADTRPAPDRIGTQGTVAPDDTTTLAVRGTNGARTIPSDAVGVSSNVAAVNMTAPLTLLTNWPDETRPLASSLNPTAGQPPTPNAERRHDVIVGRRTGPSHDVDGDLHPGTLHRRTSAADPSRVRCQSP